MFQAVFCNVFIAHVHEVMTMNIWFISTNKMVQLCWCTDGTINEHRSDFIKTKQENMEEVHLKKIKLVQAK